MILILLYPNWSSIRERLWNLKTCFYISALSLNSEEALKDTTPHGITIIIQWEVVGELKYP